MVKLTEEAVLGRARSHSLETVKKLNCWGSELTDISVVRKMENVEVINASTNRIESLMYFSQCTNLRELYLRRNSIKNLNEILHLKHLPDLRILWLSGNPCCDDLNKEKYRATVIKALPMLTKLDNTDITNEEFKKAKTEGEDLTLPIPISKPTEDSSATEHIVSSDNANKVATTAQTADYEETDENKATGNRNRKTSNDKCQVENRQRVESESETKTSSVVEETNELRKQLGLKPLPPTLSTVSQSSMSRPRTMGQTTTSINVLTATLALIREMDEDGLMTLQDAIQDRLHILRREYSGIEVPPDTSRSSNLTNGSNSDKGSTRDLA